MSLSYRSYSSSSCGFTLLEMMVVVAIMAVLASLAVPNYHKFKAQQAVNQTADRLKAHLELARTHAQSQQVTVNVCPIAVSDLSSDVPVCLGNSTPWLAWMVIHDDGRRVLARGQVSSAEVQINSSQREVIKFDLRGMSSNSNVTFAIQHLKNREIRKEFKVASTGRISL